MGFDDLQGGPHLLLGTAFAGGEGGGWAEAAKEVGTGQVKLSLFIDENGLPPLMGIITRNPFLLLFLQRQGVGSEVMLEQGTSAFDDNGSGDKVLAHSSSSNALKLLNYCYGS